jgi:hypothetical protein
MRRGYDKPPWTREGEGSGGRRAISDLRGCWGRPKLARASCAADDLGAKAETLLVEAVSTHGRRDPGLRVEIWMSFPEPAQFVIAHADCTRLLISGGEALVGKPEGGLVRKDAHKTGAKSVCVEDDDGADLEQPIAQDPDLGASELGVGQG